MPFFLSTPRVFDVWRLGWLSGRQGCVLSNALALPWATPRLQPLDGSESLMAWAGSPLCAFFVGLGWRTKNIRDCRGFCKRWQQKWFFSVGSSWDSAGKILNWLGSVVDTVTGGAKNGSSVPVLRGIMLAKKKMLEIVVASVKGGSKNGVSLSVLRGTMPGKL